MKYTTFKDIFGHELVKKNKFAAIKRVIKHALLVRLHPHPIVYPFVEGTRLLIERGISSGELQVYTSLHDFREMLFVLHYLEKEDTFVDVGANIGVYTILASGCKQAKSIACEPIPATFNRLRMNVALNNIADKTTLLNIGIGEEKSSIQFTSSIDAINHVVSESESNDNTISVAVECLDQILINEKPSILKIDVEGYETKVIKGAQNTLANSSLKAIIIELNGLANRYGFDENQIHQNILSHGFQPYDYDPHTRTLTKLNSYNNTNTIYLREVEFVKERLLNAKKINISNILI